MALLTLATLIAASALAKVTAAHLAGTGRRGPVVLSAAVASGFAGGFITALLGGFLLFYFRPETSTIPWAAQALIVIAVVVPTIFAPVGAYMGWRENR